jgi:kynurenine 3-monooxygenase
MKKITIVGAGLVGSLQAIFLAKKGFEVHVFERRPDIRKANISAGKSINLVISHRGWNALKSAGIAEQIEPITVPVFARMTHDIAGNQTYLPYSIKQQAIHSVSRGELNARLIDIAESFENVHFYFNEKCVDIHLDDAICHFENLQTGEKTTIQSNLVVGSDGAFSAVRQKMMAVNRFNYSQTYIEHGYKELIIPPLADGTPQLKQDALHIWPRKSMMLMALANLDGGFTCTLFMPFEGENSFESIQNETDLMKFFTQFFPDAIPLMPTLKKDFFNNPASSLVIVRSNPWHYKDKVVLIGDAAHAIVPFYGEGMNCGFEDCFVFNQLLDKHQENITDLLKEYTQLRQPNGNAIADLSLRNFIEMRDLVADPAFILRKKIEAKIYAKYPDKWIPLYSQVKFSNIQYAEAKKNGEFHDKIMEEVMAMPNISDIWDSEIVEQKIIQQL